jgi:transposase
MIKQSKDSKIIRYEMVRYAREHGVKPAAREFHTTPKTIRKWLQRWEPGSLRGLEELSRAPKNPPRRVTPAKRREVIALKKSYRSFGAERLRRDFALPVCGKTARKIWREEGLLKKKRRKHKTKQCLREVKAQWRLFEQTSLDTKDLVDIPELWPQIQRLGLPKVQYTAREVTSGLQFVAFAQERALCYATLFARILIEHLQR